MKKKIAIFCGGPSSEHEVSLNSARTIFKHLDNTKYQITICYISKELNAKVFNDIDLLDTEIVTNTSLAQVLTGLKEKGYFALLAGLHGEFVEDGRLQGLLELFSIPYSGSGVSGSALAMDKYRSSLIASKIPQLRIPPTALINDFRNIDVSGLHYPLILKPNTLGSSVGVYIVKNIKELKDALEISTKKLGLNEILVQECIENAVELSCGCLQKKNGKFIDIPPIEIRPKQTFFDYASKYEIGGSEEITPPVSISKIMSNKISKVTNLLHTYLGLQTYSRSDFLVKNGEIYYLETNTLPGMTATSLLPQEAKEAGIQFPVLLDFLIENS